MESREQFEKWFNETWPCQDMSAHKEKLTLWLAWSASRADICVQLPEPYDDGHGNLWLPQSNTESAICAAGLSVKER